MRIMFFLEKVEVLLGNSEVYMEKVLMENCVVVIQRNLDYLELLGSGSKYPNFVLSSRCDIPPMSPLENIQAFFDAADEFYNK